MMATTRNDTWWLPQEMDKCYHRKRDMKIIKEKRHQGYDRKRNIKVMTGKET